MNHYGSIFGEDMKSITIHNMDDELYNALKQRAKKNRNSMNKEIKALLALQISDKPKEDFSRFLNLWDKDDLEEFERNTADMNKVNDADWR